MLVSIVIIAGIAVGSFLLSLILSKRQKLRADKFLIMYLTFFIVSQVYFYLEALGTFQYSVWMLGGRGIYLLGGPLFFYYVYTLTTSRSIPPTLYVLTLLPFTGYIVHFLYYYLYGFEGREITVENGLLYFNGRLPFLWTFFVVLLTISDPFYLAWFYVLLKKYRQRSIDALSNLEKINLRWLNVVLYLWIISVVIYFPLLAFSVGQKWFNSQWMATVLQVDYLVFIFMLGFYGFKQSVVFTMVEPVATIAGMQTSAYQRSGLTPEQAAIYHRDLLAYMERDRPWLDGELTAQQLAAQLSISLNHLSQVINQIEGKNFFEFINNYRVEEVKRKMAESRNANLTLLAIALDSGFNSKSSFNTVFKKTTGQTPSQYYKSLSSRKTEIHSKKTS